MVAEAFAAAFAQVPLALAPFVGPSVRALLQKLRLDMVVRLADSLEVDSRPVVDTAVHHIAADSLRTAWARLVAGMPGAVRFEDSSSPGWPLLAASAAIEVALLPANPGLLTDQRELERWMLEEK